MSKQQLQVVLGPVDMNQALEELCGRFERGEIHCAAVRAYRADGTWGDFALGGTPAEQEAALAALRGTYGAL